ncbi:glycosyltransferase family 2 protein [Clostridium tarantellae]|uniref:Glycosyltransferase n=1 Tax=Clostridium tarantellae TaxID=39493 RepID=A0A6I1MHP6_9CLOT|nr:glycosyltransferase [Clostridium tarantellae]MPQ43056.1 glycosyltransferase [Clostridium tarantellae]
MKAEISVIVPVYNVEKYLNNCIESIINQSFKNIEILLIDDGSTDNSGEICDEYGKKDNRIKVIHKENEGVSIARNTGINNAEGKYIAFVDSDDFIHKNMYEILYKFMCKEKTDVVMCKYNRVLPNNELISEEEPLKAGIYNKDEIFNNLILPMIGNELEDLGEPLIMGSIWRCLYKKDIIDKNKIKFPRIKIAEDMLFNLDYLGRCYKAKVINKQLYYYRYNKESATKHYKDNLWEIAMEQVNLTEKKLLKLNLLNEKSKERLKTNKLQYIIWSIINEAHPKNLKNYKQAIKKMKRFGKDNNTKEVLTWENIRYYPLKQRIALICMKLKLYSLIYIYENRKIKNS